MMRLWIFLGGLNGFVAIVAGAVGAHILQNRISPDQLKLFAEAANYQLVHALALIGAGLLSAQVQPAGHKIINGAGAAFSLGILLFCGALYGLAIDGPGSIHWMAPFGGICLMSGWLALAASAIFIKKDSKQ
jgi:uncharacterized membrane protein YgdD (TMEM256/DUF423 family)